MDPASIRSLSDPRIADDLATYHENTAARLRAHADYLRKSKTVDLARKARRARAGRLAYALTENGMDRSQAIREAARECNTPAETVHDALSRLETYLAVKRQDRLKAGVASLASKGYSLRDIEAETGVARSTAARWIRTARTSA